MDDSRSGWQGGPAELKSISGQKARYLMFENPALFEYAFDQEFETLRNLREEATKHTAGRDGVEQPGPTDNMTESTINETALHIRMAEVLLTDCRRAASELMYLAVCDRFRRMTTSLVQPLKDGGYVSFRSIPVGALTTDVHSALALQAVEEHVSKSFATPPGMPSHQLLQVPLFTIGPAYCMSVLFGYVLRRAEQHYQLEQMLSGTGDRADEGDSANAPGGALLQYIERSIGPGTGFQTMMLSWEAQAAAALQVEALFGDIHELKRVAFANYEPGRKFDLQGAVQRGEIPSLQLTTMDLRRLMLEAVAFGVRLNDVEGNVQGIYELSTPEHTQFRRFGLNLDSQGRVIK